MTDAAPSPQRLARITGLLYLVIAVFGMYAPITLETLVVPGDAQATAEGILGAPVVFAASLVSWVVIVAADVAISVTFYLLLLPTGRLLSLTAAAFRLVYTAMLASLLPGLFDAYMLLTDPTRGAGMDPEQVQAMAASALEGFGSGFVLALVIFGIHLLVLGYLLYRSRYVPRVLGGLLVAAGVGYMADGLASFFVAGYGGAVSALLLAPALLGELGLTVWLLFRGVSVEGSAAPSD